MHDQGIMRCRELLLEKTMKYFVIATLFLFAGGCLTDEQQAELAVIDSVVAQETEVDTFIVGGRTALSAMETPEGESLRLANDSIIQNIHITIAGNNNSEEHITLENTIVKNPDVGPSFPGGSNAMDKFIAEHLIYPLVAFQNEIAGTVNVRFVVETDGSLTGILVQKGIGYGCDESAVDLIKSMPKWTPGKKGGVNVRCSVVLPIYFGRKNPY